ncbi:hypothetical protein BD779DRAFT_1559591 [Infundibulicybe gibba]|nr:hypothetical protein BD779DRAFT_1559591 [Infundibulicybe gibba]
MHQQQQQAQTDLRRPITSFSDLSQSNPPQQSQPAQNIFSVQIPPMDKQNFETTFKNFCVNKGLKPAGLMIEHRPVDIHALHTCVMQEGGFQKVQQAGLWDVIAGRLGFVQFPGSGTQPPKSGPGVAQSLANIYTDYLVVFERMYVENVIVSGRKMLGQPGGTGPQTPHLQANQQPNQQRPAFNARQMELLMSPTAQEFRSRGVSKKVTQVAESQRAAHDQTQSIVVPTQEQLQQALIFINKFRSEFIANNLPKLGPQIAIVEQIHRHSQETGDKLPCIEPAFQLVHHPGFVVNHCMVLRCPGTLAEENLLAIPHRRCSFNFVRWFHCGVLVDTKTRLRGHSNAFAR